MNDASTPNPLPKDPKTERLAKALRENLRRRKAPPASSGEDANGPPKRESAS